jgi:hypothetical protein
VEDEGAAQASVGTYRCVGAAAALRAPALRFHGRSHPSALLRPRLAPGLDARASVPPPANARRRTSSHPLPAPGHLGAALQGAAGGQRGQQAAGGREGQPPPPPPPPPLAPAVSTCLQPRRAAGQQSPSSVSAGPPHLSAAPAAPLTTGPAARQSTEARPSTIEACPRPLHRAPAAPAGLSHLTDLVFHCRSAPSRAAPPQLRTPAALHAFAVARQAWALSVRGVQGRRLHGRGDPLIHLAGATPACSWQMHVAAQPACAWQPGCRSLSHPSSRARCC